MVVMEIMAKLYSSFWRTTAELTATDLVSFGAAQLMIFGGVVPYIPQYLEIKRTKNADGFSTFVCLTLLVANTLRILFWFGHPFEVPLFMQSVIMIVAMLLMVQLCTIMKNGSEIIHTPSRQFTDLKAGVAINGSALESGLHPTEGIRQRTRHRFLDSQPASCQDLDRRHFWQWTDFRSYLQFMAVFSASIGLVTWLLLDVPVYIELLGFLAVFFEAMLGAPQFYRNYCNKSTAGMSVGMVCMWLSGDIFKTLYFVIREAPIQFWLCGVLQVGLDLSILAQVLYYRMYPHGAFKSAIQ